MQWKLSASFVAIAVASMGTTAIAQEVPVTGAPVDQTAPQPPVATPGPPEPGQPVPVSAPSPNTAPATVASQQEPVTYSDEIMVTARRRSETTLDVPVAVSALSATQLTNSGANSLNEIGRLVPGLIVADNAGSGTISLRGVSSPTASSSIEQAVSINIDGVPISYAGVVSLGYFDLGQVEVLKGPQALFFGKNATAGVIALKSADPTPEFEGKVTGGYEFIAHEWFTEGVVSGPLTSTLGGRLAVRYGDSRGYFKNELPRNLNLPGVFGPKHRYGPGGDSLAARGTLKWEPNSQLTVRAKASYNKQNTGGVVLQNVYCPNGVSQIRAGDISDDCKANRYFTRSDINPLIAQHNGASDVPFAHLNLFLGTLDVQYNVADGVTLSSNTGYFKSKNTTQTESGHSPRSVVGVLFDTHKKQFTQEVRLSTDFDSPINGMIGIFYADDEFDDHTSQAIALAPRADGSQTILRRTPYEATINSETFSGFAQLRWNLLDSVELSGGARYTHERKSASVLLPTANPVRDATSLVTPNSILFTDVSPEVTLSYRPGHNTNLYVSYKQGYKAGGYQFNTDAAGAFLAGETRKLDYGKEDVEGFEAGAKTMLLDRQLRVDMSIYRYKYADLQVTRFDPVLLSSTLSNADGAINKGVELAVNYAPRAISGLTLSGAVNYNSMKYEDFFSACYTGQTIAQGCNITSSLEIVDPATYAANPTPANTGRLQDLSGKRIPRAPAWTGNVALAYQKPIGDLKAGFDASANYSSKFYVSQERVPEAFQPDFWRIDLGVRLGSEDNRWEVAFNVNNVTNEFVQQTGFQTPLTGTSSLTGTNTPGGYADVLASLTNGREYRLRTTFRF